MPDLGYSSLPALSVAPASPPNNPLATVGQFAGIQNQLNQNQLFQQTFAARQLAGRIMASSPDTETGLATIMKSPAAPFMGEFVNQVRQGMLANTTRQGQIQTQANAGVEGFNKNSLNLLANPSAFTPLAQATLATVPPEAQGQVAKYIGSLRDSLTQGLPSDPMASASELQKRIVALSLSTGHAPGDISALTGTNELINTGGSQLPVVRAPAFAGGGLSSSGAPISNTLAPQIHDLPAGGGSTVPTIVGGGGERNLPSPGPLGNILDNANANVPGGTPSSNGLGGTPLSAPTPGTQQSKYLADRGSDMAAYQKSLDDRTMIGGRIMQTLTEARNAQSQFRPGGGASTYAGVAQLAQAFGASQDMVDKIANGDLSASQEFQKLMVNTTMGQIKEQLPAGGSRLSQMEFAEFNKNNPNIDTDPRAIDKIFNFWTKLYQRDRAEQGELGGYIDKGGDLSKWPAAWQDIAQKRGYITPEVTAEPGKGRPPLSQFLK